MPTGEWRIGRGQWKAKVDGLKHPLIGEQHGRLSRSNLSQCLKATPKPASTLSGGKVDGANGRPAQLRPQPGSFFGAELSHGYRKVGGKGLQHASHTRNFSRRPEQPGQQARGGTGTGMQFERRGCGYGRGPAVGELGQAQQIVR